MKIVTASTDLDPINIQELNYECIEHICSFLDIADLVSVATACPSVFFDHCQDCLENEMLTSDIINQISLRMDRRHFFATYGRIIRRLCITPFVEDCIDWLRLVGTYCPNVTSMRFCSPKLKVGKPSEDEEVVDRPCNVATITEMVEGPSHEERIEVINRSHEYLLNRFWIRYARLAILKLSGPVRFRGPIQELVNILKMDGDLRRLRWMAEWLAENNIKIIVVEEKRKDAPKNDRLAVATSGATKRRMVIYNPIAEIKKKCSRVLTVILQR